MARTKPFPTAAVADKVGKSVTTARRDFADHELLIEPTQRRRMTRPRPGSDKISAVVLEAAAQVGLELPTLPSAAVRDSMAAAARLRPLVATTRALHQSVADTAYSAESEAWGGTLTYYSVLSRIAEHNEHLRQMLVPAAEFFARRSSPVREEQVVTRARRKVERATQQVAKAKQAAEIIMARRGSPEPDAPAPVPKADGRDA